MAELYSFVTDGQTACYTSADHNLYFKGREYKAVPITRTGFTTDTKMGEVKVSVKAPMLSSFIAWIADQPVSTTKVTIYQALIENLEHCRVLFYGTVFNVSTKQRVASAQCVANSDILKTKIPNIIYQSFCNHDLFDKGCKLIASNWRVAATVDKVIAGSIISPELTAKPDGHFTGGYLEYGGNARLVTLHKGDNANLHVPFDSKVGSGVKLWAYPGCDGNPETCKSRFNNFDNFLGMPMIPSHNPVLWGFTGR